MGRDLRVIDPDSIYHVISTGSDKGPIVWDGHDYDSLRRGAGQGGHALRVGGLRVVRDDDAPPRRAPGTEGWPLSGLSAGERLPLAPHESPTRTRRRISSRTGPTRSEMESDAHLVAGIRYVVRNPIEAGICERASQWPFSSYRATVGLAEAPPWLQARCCSTSSSAAPRSSQRLVHGGHLPVSDTDGSR